MRNKMIIPIIDCAIFSEHREKIETLSQAINGAKIISNEVEKAQQLLKIVDILLTCGKYDEHLDDCENCHYILNLNKEMAEAIIRASKLEVC